MLSLRGAGVLIVSTKSFFVYNYYKLIRSSLQMCEFIKQAYYYCLSFTYAATEAQRNKVLHQGEPIPGGLPMVTWYVVVHGLKTTSILLHLGVESPLGSTELEHYKI